MPLCLLWCVLVPCYISISWSKRLTFMYTEGLLNCLDVFKKKLFDNNTVNGSVENMEFIFLDFSVGVFHILCFIQYILGVWKIPCVQFSQWSQTALPDNIRFASTNSSALCYEQWVFINTGSSDGECDKSLRLSNVVSCCLCNSCVEENI